MRSTSEIVGSSSSTTVRLAGSSPSATPSAAAELRALSRSGDGRRSRPIKDCPSSITRPPAIASGLVGAAAASPASAPPVAFTKAALGAAVSPVGCNGLPVLAAATLALVVACGPYKIASPSPRCGGSNSGDPGGSASGNVEPPLTDSPQTEPAEFVRSTEARPRTKVGESIEGAAAASGTLRRARRCGRERRRNCKPMGSRFSMVYFGSTAITKSGTLPHVGCSMSVCLRCNTTRAGRAPATSAGSPSTSDSRVRSSSRASVSAGNGVGSCGPRTGRTWMQVPHVRCNGT
eukprot:scaffold80958_cov24-Tisochrysis_lutea.AAC.2